MQSGWLDMQGDSIVPPTVHVSWSDSSALASTEILAECSLESGSIDCAPQGTSAAYTVGWVLERLHVAVSADIKVL